MKIRLIIFQYDLSKMKETISGMSLQLQEPSIYVLHMVKILVHNQML